MGPTIVLHHTQARHRGRRVTVLGIPSAGLLAVTGYGTRGQRVLGIITVIERRGQRAYRIHGHDDELHDLDTAAAVLAQQRS
jgi:hypothetical protein